MILFVRPFGRERNYTIPLVLKKKIIFRFAFAILNVLLDIFFQDSERGMNHTSSPEYVPVICLLGRS